MDSTLAAGIVFAVCGKEVVVLDGLGNVLAAGALGERFEGIKREDGRLLGFGDQAGLVDERLLGLVEDVPGVLGEGRVLSHAVLIEMAVTDNLRLVEEAMTVGADEDRSAGVQRVLRQDGQPLAGTGARLLRPGDAAQTEQTLKRIHMPQLSDYSCWAHEAIQTLYAQLENVKRYSPTLLMVLSFINRSYTTDLSLTQLAEYAYTNASSLSSEFNNEVGMSLSEYVTMLRVRHARKLLRETDCSIAEIAEAADFSSTKYFREIFKKQTGMSPQQYRDQ